LCPEAGRVDAFMQATSILGQWLEDADTDPGVADYIVEYVQGRGSVTMEEVVRNAHVRYQTLEYLKTRLGEGRFWKA
jgi:hypothetical protein